MSVSGNVNYIQKTVVRAKKTIGLHWS